MEKEKLRNEDLVDTKDSVDSADMELSARINRLYGKEGSTKNYKEQKEYSSEEILIVRKKLILLLTVVILGGLIMFIIFINPFDFSNYQKDDEVEESVENKKENQLGAMSLTDDLVMTLSNYVSFYTNDFGFVDLTQLYAEESLEIEAFPNDIKLFLLQKNNGIYDILNDAKANDYFSTCDNDAMVIERSKFDDLVSKVYGPDIAIEYTDFNFLYYREAGASIELNLTFHYEKEKEQYAVKCSDWGENFNLDRIVQQELVKAERTENSIELYQYVVFINRDGVYKDFAMKELITNDLLAQKTDYISKGSMYKYIFTQDGSNFYLSRVDLVKEAN